MFSNKFISLILTFFVFDFSSSKLISNIYESNQICSLPTYDNTSITEECTIGPNKKTRILKYSTFEQYINDHRFKHNGLPFYSSLFVDTDFHNFYDFMDGGMVIIILFIIALICLIAWIPFICCWKYRCCIYDECCIDTQGCNIFWHLVTYILFAAIFSFLIVCVIFSE